MIPPIIQSILFRSGPPQNLADDRPVYRLMNQKREQRIEHHGHGLCGDAREEEHGKRHFLPYDDGVVQRQRPRAIQEAAANLSRQNEEYRLPAGFPGRLALEKQLCSNAREQAKEHWSNGVQREIHAVSAHEPAEKIGDCGHKHAPDRPEPEAGQDDGNALKAQAQALVDLNAGKPCKHDLHGNQHRHNGNVENRKFCAAFLFHSSLFLSAADSRRSLFVRSANTIRDTPQKKIPIQRQHAGTNWYCSIRSCAVADAALYRRPDRLSCKGDFPSACHLTHNAYSTKATVFCFTTPSTGVSRRSLGLCLSYTYSGLFAMRSANICHFFSAFSRSSPSSISMRFKRSRRTSPMTAISSAENA